MIDQPKTVILIVEDDRSVRDTIVNYFDFDFPGAEILEADNAVSAAEIMRTKKPAVMISDMGFPQDRGGQEDSLAGLANIGEGLKQGIKCIAMTGKPTDQIEAFCEKNAVPLWRKANDSIDALVAHVQRALTSSPAQHSSAPARGAGL